MAPPVYIKKWGGTGTAPGQFIEVSSVEVTSTGEVLGVGHENRVQVFTSDGALKYIFGTQGTGDGEFNHPHGISITRGVTPNIAYVGDQDNGRIQVWTITPDGATFIKNIGNSDVVHIHDIGIDQAQGYVYAPDYQIGILQKFDPITDALIWKATGHPGGWGAATDSVGFIYLATTDAQELRKLDPGDGRTIKSIGGFSGGQGITGVYVDKHDLVYAVDAPKKTVFIYDTNLNLMTSWYLPDIVGTISKPEDITITDDDLGIYIADSITNYVYYLKRTAQ